MLETVNNWLIGTKAQCSDRHLWVAIGSKCIGWLGLVYSTFSVVVKFLFLVCQIRETLRPVKYSEHGNLYSG